MKRNESCAQARRFVPLFLCLSRRYIFVWPRNRTLHGISGGVQSVAAADSMASPRGNGQRREIACLAVQCVSLPRLASSSFPRRAENRASHTQSPLRHRRQPDALNDSRGVIRRSPNPAPKSRYCFWLFAESWGKSMAAGLHGVAKSERAKKRDCAFGSAICLSAAV